MTTLESRIELLTGIKQFISETTTSFESLLCHDELKLILVTEEREIGSITIKENGIHCYGYGKYTFHQVNFEYSDPKFEPTKIINFYKEILIEI